VSDNVNFWLDWFWGQQRV